jgi:hypothetical protein
MGEHNEWKVRKHGISPAEVMVAMQNDPSFQYEQQTDDEGCELYTANQSRLDAGVAITWRSSHLRIVTATIWRAGIFSTISHARSANPRP